VKIQINRYQIENPVITVAFPRKHATICMQGLVSLSRTSGFYVYASLCKPLNILCKALCLSPEHQVSMSMPPFANSSTFYTRPCVSLPDIRFPCVCFPLQTTQLLCKALCLSPEHQVSMSMPPFANHSTFYARPCVSLPDIRFPCLCFPLKPLNFFMQVLRSLQTICYLVSASHCNHLAYLCKASCLSPY
jgi:hypothetical protein